MASAALSSASALSTAASLIPCEEQKAAASWNVEGFCPTR